MTTPQSPQQAAMQRLNHLIDKTSILNSRANDILDIALKDAAHFSNNDSGYQPAILSEDNLVVITTLRNDLSKLVNYYLNQKEQFTASLNAIAELTSTLLESVVSHDKSQQETNVRSVTIESLRERTETLAMQQKTTDILNVSETSLKVNSHDLKIASQTNDNHATINSVDLDRHYHNQVHDNASGGLSDDSAVKEISNTDGHSSRPPENSIQRLLGPDSPLLDVFAMSPWLQNGKGFVTIGTPGFNWYKSTNPMEKDPTNRAMLPTGFYFGQDIPEFVVLRMSDCIIIWNFKLEPDCVSIYLVGPSDANIDDIRWFKISELSASYSRQVVTELLETIDKYKTDKVPS